MTQTFSRLEKVSETRCGKFFGARKKFRHGARNFFDARKTFCHEDMRDFHAKLVRQRGGRHFDARKGVLHRRGRNFYARKTFRNVARPKISLQIPSDARTETFSSVEKISATWRKVFRPSNFLPQRGAETFSSLEKVCVTLAKT